MNAAAIAPVVDDLRTHCFNNRLWPDFTKLPTPGDPALRFQILRERDSTEFGSLRIIPVPVHHAVPATGFIVHDGSAGLVFSGDTGPTDEIWKVANACPHLKAVFLECTFPNSMAWLADLAKHLTPELYAAEMRKLNRPTRFITVHMHSKHRTVAEEELLAMHLPNVELGESGRTYTL